MESLLLNWKSLMSYNASIWIFGGIMEMPVYFKSKIFVQVLNDALVINLNLLVDFYLGLGSRNYP